MTRPDGVLVGLDVGTTNVKAAAYALDGSTVAIAVRPLPVERPRPTWAEYDPRLLIETSFATLREVARALSDAGTKVLGVAVASMAETAVPVDRQGEPLHAAIAWHDERTLEQARWWREHGHAPRVHTLTGLPVQPIFGIQKIMWLRQHAPDAYARMDAWLNTADYVAYRLSGVQATDLSLASRMMVLDLADRRWSTELLSACGVPSSVLPELVASGTRLGAVTEAAAGPSGLPVGTPVVAGGHDHPCGALAVGLTEVGDVLDSMGTSESVLTITSGASVSAAAAAAGYQQGVHVAPGRTYCNGGLYTSGAAIEWARMVFTDVAQERVGALVELAGQSNDSDVLFLPHLRMANPPHVDDASRGAFVGIDVGTSRADLARAVIRGLAFEAQASLEGMERQLGFTARRMRLVGGGARNRLLVRDKAALFDGRTEVADVEEATSLGAAMLAGLGVGAFASADEAIDAMTPGANLVEVDAEEAARVRARYRDVYLHLYDALAPLHRRLRAHAADEERPRRAP